MSSSVRSFILNVKIYNSLLSLAFFFLSFFIVQILRYDLCVSMLFFLSSSSPRSMLVCLLAIRIQSINYSDWKKRSISHKKSNVNFLTIFSPLYNSTNYNQPDCSVSVHPFVHFSSSSSIFNHSTRNLDIHSSTVRYMIHHHHPSSISNLSHRSSFVCVGLVECCSCFICSKWLLLFSSSRSTLSFFFLNYKFIHKYTKKKATRLLNEYFPPFSDDNSNSRKKCAVAVYKQLFVVVVYLERLS